MRTVMFPGLRDTRPQPLAAGWPQIVAALSSHAVREEKLEGTLWSPVDYRPGTYRANRNVERVHAFVADLDGVDLDAVSGRLTGLEWHAYTTHGHRADKPSWHVVVPLAAPVEARDWRKAWLTIRRHLRAGDEATCDASRAYFIPQRHPDREAQVAHGTGAFLDWRDLPIVDVPGKTSRVLVPGRGYVIDYDDAEEPAELAGLEGMELRDAALKYVQRLLDNLAAA